MKIEKIEIDVNKSNIKIYTSCKNNAKNIKYLSFKYDDEDWYFKVSTIYIESSDNSVKYTLVADCFEYYADIEYFIDTINDYSKLIGLELKVVTDKETIDNLEDNIMLL